MDLRSGKHLSGLPAAQASAAEAVRGASQWPCNVQALQQLLDSVRAEHGEEACAAVVNGADWGGWNALHYAAAADKADAIAMLVQCGAQLRCDAEGWSPLHVACLNEAKTAVVALLAMAPEYAAHRTPDGDAPIDVAQRHAFDDIAALLSARGIPQPAPRSPTHDTDDSDESDEDDMDMSD